MKTTANNRLGIMAAGRWSHRPFVRCCASAPAGRWLFGFGFYHQHFITNLASAAGVEGILLPPQRLAANVMGNPFLKHPNCREESSKSLIIYNQLSPET